MPGLLSHRLWLVLFVGLITFFFGYCRFLHIDIVDLWNGVSQASLKSPNDSQQCQSVQFPGPGEGSGEYVVEAEHPESWPVYNFKTVLLHPPAFRVNATTDSLRPGLILMNQKNNDPGVGESYRFGLYIFTDRGELVWGKEVPWSRDLRVQLYQGRPVLTYWSAAQSAAKGISWGSITVLDSTYRQISTICPRLGLRHRPGFANDSCEADLHVGTFTDDNSILISAYNQTRADLTSVGGPRKGWIFDCLAYEIDLTTLEVVWKWNARDHIRMDASRAADFKKHHTTGTLGDAWDWFHLNSIQKVNGNYLLNARNTFQTYLVKPGGDIIWTLDGETGGDFGPLPSDAWIAFSHDARIVSNTATSHTISLFNNANGNGRYGVNSSHGLLLQLPLPPQSAPVNVLQRFESPTNPLYAVAQGNVQSLSQNHYLVGFGYVAVAQEWAVDEDDPSAPARLLWEARFGHDGDQRQYRIEKQEWHGTPVQDPVVVVEQIRTADCEWWRVYVSWNGATDVEGWTVYVGSGDEEVVACVDVIGKRGFETSFNVWKGAGCVQVGAMRGEVEVRRSALVCDL